MKKVLSLLLACMMVFSMVACGNQTKPEDTKANPETTEQVKNDVTEQVKDDAKEGYTIGFSPYTLTKVGSTLP